MRFDPRDVWRRAVACVAMMRAMRILLFVGAMRGVLSLALLRWHVLVVLVTAMSTMRMLSGLGLLDEVHATLGAGTRCVGGDIRVHGAGVGACRLRGRFGVMAVAVVRMFPGLGLRDEVHAALRAGPG